MSSDHKGSSWRAHKTDGKKQASKGAAAVPSETVRIATDLNHQTYFIGGVQVHFPFKPYPSQLGMMNHMIRALSQSKNTMIESPTGSGKSLALLCAALAWQRDYRAKNKKQIATVRQIIRRYVAGGAIVPDLPNYDSDLAKEDRDDMPKRNDIEVQSDGIKADPDAMGLSGEQSLRIKPDPDAVAAVHGTGDVKPVLDAKGVPDFRKRNVENLFDRFIYKPLDAGGADKGAATGAEHANKTTDDTESDADASRDSDSDSDFVSTKTLAKKKKSSQGSSSQQQSDISAAEKRSKSDLSIEGQVIIALLKLPSTVSYIVQASEISIPRGLTQKDIDVLKEFQDNNYLQNTPRIYFGSRTHKQVSQLIDELRRKSAYRMQTAVLGSRTQTCINREALTSGAIDDECRNLVDDEKCGPYKQYHRLAAHSRLRPGGDLEIWDIEDIVGLGKRLFACPYYAARDLAATADLVFCPYNYILDPGVREAAGISLRDNIVILDEGHNVENAAREAGSMEITDQQLGVLVGECQTLSRDGLLPGAHQFVGTFAEGLANWLQDDSDEYDYQEFDALTAVWPKPNESVQDLFGRLVITPAFIARLDLVYAELEDFMKQQRLDKDSADASDMSPAHNNPTEPIKDNVNNDGEQDENSRWKKRKKHLSQGSMRVIGGLLRVLRLMSSPESPFYHDYRVAKIRRKAITAAQAPPKGKRKRVSLAPQSIPEYINVLAFWALNPGIVFSEISSLTRSVVLTSGTLSPLSSYASELQMVFSSTLEANHVIDPSRFAAMAIEYGPLGTRLEAKYQTFNMLEFQDDVGKALCSIAASCPDGMLVFAPSYSLLNKLFARWSATGLLDTLQSHKHVFVEPQGGSKEQFEKLLKAYRGSLEKDRVPGEPLSRGAIMFAVYRGKVSEGIDFSDHFCRTVVNIGIPYPAFKDVKVSLKREYNDSRASLQYQHQMATPETNMLNGALWYEIQAFRAINQALGRCLRHRSDWGAVIMLESRFALPWNVSKLSKWIRNYMKLYGSFDSAMSELELFYKTRIAEDVTAAAAAAAAAVSLSDSSANSTTAVVTPTSEHSPKTE